MPTALLFATAAVSFVLQAALGAIWLTGIAIDGVEIIPSTRDTLLIVLQVYGFLLAAFLGVGLRAFPTFFGMPGASRRQGIAAVVLVQAGIALCVAGQLGYEWGWETGFLTAGGEALLGLAVLVAVSTFGWWRKETRLAVASQPLAWSLRAALMWLTTTGVLLTATGLRALAEGEPVSTTHADAVRHVFVIGVVTLGITAVAQLILPEFASERMTRRTTHWRGAAFAAALSAAVVLRALLPLTGIDMTLRYWLMALAGVIAMSAVVWFAVLIARARRSHVSYQQRVAAFRARQISTLE
jgi:hypothetical protein